MFEGKKIQQMMDMLHTKGIKLYHACQYQDFISYLKIGGIPSRELLQNRNLKFTPFSTDNSDRIKGVYDKVFLNIQDFGGSYHRGGESVPNPYGPITIEISPTASLYMSDLSVTLRSAGAGDFSREKESLKTINDFEKIFKKSGNRYFVKYRKELLADFPRSRATSPEISCTFPGQLLSVDHFERIVVDPIYFEDNTLTHYVELVAKHLYSNLDVLVTQRVSRRDAEYQELCYGIAQGWNHIDDVLNNSESPELEDWADQVQSLDYQFVRFAKYLRTGTLEPLAKSKVHLLAAA